MCVFRNSAPETYYSLHWVWKGKVILRDALGEQGELFTDVLCRLPPKWGGKGGLSAAAATSGGINAVGFASCVG